MDSNLRSFLQGRFMKHPLHPILVHLPVGLWTASLISDIAFLASGNSNFAVVSYYTILFGIVGAVLAVITGVAEYVAIPNDTKAKRIAATHMTLNIFVTLLYGVNFLARRSLEGGVPSLVTGGEFILSIFSVIVLGISGFLGGLLVYNYGIGFKPQLRDRHETGARPPGERAA